MMAGEKKNLRFSWLMRVSNLLWLLKGFWSMERGVNEGEVRCVASRHRAFLVMAPWLWNSLSLELSKALSLLSIQWDLKTFLRARAFNRCGG